MSREKVKRIASTCLASVVLMSVAWRAQAEDAKTYTSMAPLDQYLMADRNAEIALARSAAPESISRDAEVMVLGRHGYETAVKGRNGFVCIVERSWMAPFDDAEFLNPDQRLPLCLNPPAVRTHLLLTLKTTELTFAGLSKTQIFDGIKAAFDKRELPLPEPGAMCYMMSKQGYLSDDGGHWHPHLMFYLANTEAAAWGANLDGSPVFADDSTIFAQKGRPEPVTTFFVPITQWSDGTPSTKETH